MRHSEYPVSSRWTEDTTDSARVDAVLLERCQRGERAALETLVERVQCRVYNFAVRASGSQTAASRWT